eukprot:gene10808-14509_t
MQKENFGVSSPKEERIVAIRRGSSMLNDKALENLKDIQIEFVPPEEGTPAAQALAANATIKVSKLERGFHKLRTLKRPKLKNLNIKKQLNKRTKATRKKHFSKNFKGKVIDGVHELYTLTAGIMLGIRYTVGNSSHNNEEKLTLLDFNQVENIFFPPKGNNTPPHITPPHSLVHTFKFKSYSPKVFKRLRDFYDIDAASYMLSVCGDYNFIEFISNSKSGQFFFYSHDGKYMLKTQTKEENKFMKRILPHYYKFLTENPHSTLVRILGMHRVKMYHLRRKVHFVIMTSVFDTPAKIDTIFDLKGSTVGRISSAKDRATGGVLKDQDLICDGVKFHLGPKKAKFIEQLERDAMFLASLNIMDYSLLVGIHHRSAREDVPPAIVESGVNEAQTNSTTAVMEINTTSDPLSGNMNTRMHSNTPFRRTSISGPMSSPNKPNDQRDSISSAGGEVCDIDNGGNAVSISPKSDGHLSAAIRESDEIKSSKKGATLGAELLGDDSENEAMRRMTIGINSPHPNQRRRSSSHMKRAFSRSADYQETSPGKIGSPTNRAKIGFMGGDDAEELSGVDEDDYEGELDDPDLDDGDSVYADEHNGDNGVSMMNGQTDITKFTHVGEVAVEEDGVGAMGEEGQRLKEIFRAVSAGRNKKNYMSTEYTYGPGITLYHPWTSRVDGGINSRSVDGTNRMDEIYFMGIIDILQQYNASKRTETFIKGFTNDAKQISSVDPVSYAKRFIKFMEDNMD